MNTYRQRFATLRGAATVSRWSDRQAALTILSLPFILTPLAFLLTVIVTSMDLTQEGSLGLFVGGISYAYLIVCLIWLPSYAIGYGWYWWKTKLDGNLCKPLLWLPLLIAAFAWFPAALLPIPGNIQTKWWQIFFVLGGMSLVTNYLWVGIVRLILRYWRKL